MTASRTPARKQPRTQSAGGPTSLVSPVIDCEPAPVGATAPCRSTRGLRQRTPRRLRPAPPEAVREACPPAAAVAFADAALRRVLEVIDRRRPVAQLRPLLAPALIDSVVALTRSPRTAAAARPQSSATLRRIRLRTVEGGPEDASAAEVFGTYTRGARVHAIAARIARDGQRWRIAALQVG